MAVTFEYFETKTVPASGSAVFAHGITLVAGDLAVLILSQNGGAGWNLTPSGLGTWVQENATIGNPGVRAYTITGVTGNADVTVASGIYGGAAALWIVRGLANPGVEGYIGATDSVDGLGLSISSLSPAMGLVAGQALISFGLATIHRTPTTFPADGTVPSPGWTIDQPTTGLGSGNAGSTYIGMSAHLLGADASAGPNVIKVLYGSTAGGPGTRFTLRLGSPDGIKVAQVVAEAVTATATELRAASVYTEAVTATATELRAASVYTEVVTTWVAPVIEFVDGWGLVDQF